MDTKRTFTSLDMNTITKNGIRNLRLESIYHAMETSFGVVRANIVSGLQLTTTDIDAVVHFVAAQMVRTPKFRSYWRLAEQDEREAQMSAIEDLKARTILANTISSFDNNHQQIKSLITFPEALDLLGGMRAQFFKTPNPRAFITSDAPCCVIDYKDKARSLFDSLSGPTTNVLMPLSPDVIVLFDKSEKPHEMTQMFSGHLIVEHFNAMIWAGAVTTVVLPGQDISPEWLAIPVSSSGAAYVVM